MSTAENDFIEVAEGRRDRIRPTVNRIRRDDKITVLVKWDGKTGVLTGVINDTWPDAESDRFPQLDPRKHVNWAWDQSTFVDDGKTDDITNINDDLSETFFTGASSKLSDAGRTQSAKDKDALLKIAGVKKQSSNQQVKVRYWFVHEPISGASATPKEAVPAGELAEEDAESAEVEVQESIQTLETAIKKLEDKTLNAVTNPADAFATAEKNAAEAAVTEAKIAAEEAQKRAEEAKAESDAIKHTSLRYSELVYPNQDQARFRELFVQALNSNGRPSWWIPGSSWSSYVIDSNKIHRFGPGGTMLWGVQHGGVGYFAEENIKGNLSISQVPKTTRPFPRGWVAGTKKSDSSTKPDGAEADGGSTAKDDSAEHGPLNKQFTALFARLRDLEARLALPQTLQNARDARPVAEHLADLRRKIVRTRSLIERDASSMRRVYV